MLVSIVIPTKNRVGMLPETLASVRAQTYPHWEAIVVDDGSIDGTDRLVESMAAQDGRVRYLRRERRPRGASVCRNIGVSAAQGTYVLFLDSDDLLAPLCLARRVEIMEQNPDLDFATFLTGVFYKTPGDNPYLWNDFTGEDDLDRFLRRDPPWQTSGPLWRRSSLAKVGPWDELALGSQDWEFHIRALAAGLKYRKVREEDNFWRKTRSDSITQAWRSDRYLCNRVRLYRRVVAELHAHGQMNVRRRRLLAAEFFEHAFMLDTNRALALKIWRAAKRAEVVGGAMYRLLLAEEMFWRAVRYAGRRPVRLLFPGLGVRKKFASVRRGR